MAGIVGAITSGSLRIAGNNWDVRLKPLKFLQEDNLGAPNDAAAAICHAVDHGTSLILAAWGGRGCESIELKNAILYAKNQGVLFVTAAGNDGQDVGKAGKEFYPAFYSKDHDNVVVVGATKEEDSKSEYTNFGPDFVQLAAPGVRTPVLGPERTRPVWPATGTSVSTAYVAGAAALVAAELGNVSLPGQPLYKLIRDRLFKGADQICQLKSCFQEGRRLNAYNAVRNLDGLNPLSCIPAPPC